MSQPESPQKPKRGAAYVKQTIEMFDSLPNSAGVRLPVVCALFGRSAASVWRDSKAGRLPSPHKSGPRCTVWRVGDLREHLATFREAA